MNYANLASAQKRAKHFSNVVFSGPFSVIGSTGAMIAARNYSLLLDSHDRDTYVREAGCTTPTTAQDEVDDIAILDMWARGINAFCDNNQVSTNEDAKIAFSSFLSRMWFDASKL